MDLNKLTVGDRVLVISALVFFFAALLPWFGESSVNGFAFDSLNGFDFFFTGLVPVLLVAATLALVLLTRFSNVRLPNLPLPFNQLLLIPAIVAAMLVLLRLLIGDGVDFGDLGRKVGIFLALLSAIGVCVGAVLKLQERDDAPPAGGSTPPQPF